MRITLRIIRTAQRLKRIAVMVRLTGKLFVRIGCFKRCAFGLTTIKMVLTVVSQMFYFYTAEKKSVQKLELELKYL